MTKFLATVCLPPTPPHRVPDAIAVAMAPYDMNATDDWNPVGEWDGWMIHVRPGTPYLVRPEHDGDPRLLTAGTVPPSAADLAPLGPLECYGGPRGLLDLAAMRRRAVRGREAPYAARVEDPRAVVPGHALLTLDGRWRDAGTEGYREWAAGHLERLDPEAVLVDVLCHC
ncbi:hypothetical protein ACF1GT_28315 [Streptomyces sp. NPDC014636]|uniref:hypothetical protein n=1 Tax=Streptomyces sp. NPDC014636 TaxID=3364876 RepID=UPI0036F9C7BF